MNENELAELLRELEQSLLSLKATKNPEPNAISLSRPCRTSPGHLFSILSSTNSSSSIALSTKYCLNRLAEVGWESDTDETIRQVEVEIHQEPTRHIVNVPKLLNWVKQDTARPGQQTQKEKLRKLLGGR